MRWSWPAGVFTVIYTVAATYVVVDDFRSSGGGWINLRGMGAAIATLPSQVTLGNFLRMLGFEKINYSYPKFGDYLESAIHVLVSALFVYLMVLGLEFLVRRLFATT